MLLSTLRVTSLETTGSPGVALGLASVVGRLTRCVRLPVPLRMMLRCVEASNSDIVWYRPLKKWMKVFIVNGQE